MIIQGDCLEKLKELPDSSVDAIVTDPPYELGFMGKGWDKTGIANNVDMWKECLRVLKPGGHLLAFSGTRTYHRMASAIEDAGFDIRDQIAWCYGQGFPKSLNISLQIKKKYNIGLCTCNVFEPMIELGYENSNNKRDNISNGDNDGLGSGEQIRSKGNDNNEVAEQIKDTHISSNSTIRKESRMCELSEDHNQKEQGLEKVSESILQSGVCKPISENERLGNTTIRTGVEEVKTTSAGEGQGLSDMQNKTTNGITSSSPDSVQNGGQELNGEPSGSLSELPQQDREDNRKRIEQVKNDCGTEEWNNLSRFICSKCYCLKKDIGGTALKPSIEPICMARKPLAEKTVAENVLKYGTGGINIDGCRVESRGDHKRPFVERQTKDSGEWETKSGICKPFQPTNAEGRFPANLIHDNSEEVRECFPDTKSGGSTYNEGTNNNWIGSNKIKYVSTVKDSGNASRFFKSIIYQAKSPKSERLICGFDCVKLEEWTQQKKTKQEEENTVAEVSLVKVILGLVAPSLSIGGYGNKQTEAYPTDFISTIRTAISKITELKTWNLLIQQPTNDSILAVIKEVMAGINYAEFAVSEKELIKRIGIFQKKITHSTEDVKNATYQSLLKISKPDAWQDAYSHHPTHKPIALMEYLINMVTREGQTVLDPFAGSGTTLIAAKKLGRKYIGIELEPEYIKIAEARIKSVQERLV